jgi:hypothetical protein
MSSKLIKKAKTTSLDELKKATTAALEVAGITGEDKDYALECYDRFARDTRRDNYDFEEGCTIGGLDFMWCASMKRAGQDRVYKLRAERR